MKNLSQCTVVFLIRDLQVLLGYKKTGFGKGNYLGIGGKIEATETAKAAAIREVSEEIQVHIEESKLVQVADLTFLFPHQPDWNQQVHVFSCSNWNGTPTESSEIKPDWFNQTNLPFSQMWDDAKFWLPAILTGHTFSGKFIFNSDLKVISTNLQEQAFM